MSHAIGSSRQRLARVPDDGREVELRGKRAVTYHRLMNACSSIIVESGFRAVSMTSIAGEADLTRQTAYRYFADAEEVITATIMRAGREVLEAQYLALREEGEPKDLLVTAVMTTLRIVSNNRLLIAAIEIHGNTRSFLKLTLDGRIANRSVEELRCIGDRVGWNESDRREVNEIIVRFIDSFLNVPPADTRESSIRSALYRRLIPALGL